MVVCFPPPTPANATVERWEYSRVALFARSHWDESKGSRLPFLFDYALRAADVPGVTVKDRPKVGTLWAITKRSPCYQYVYLLAKSLTILPLASILHSSTHASPIPNQESNAFWTHLVTSYIEKSTWPQGMVTSPRWLHYTKLQGSLLSF